MKKSIRLFLMLPTVVLVIAGACYFSFKAIEQSIIEKNEALVYSMAQQLLPALLANDIHKVESLLHTLATYPGIETAELVSSAGITVASYVREGFAVDPSSAQFALASADEAIGPYGLHVAAPLTFDTQILANLHIAVNLWPAYLRIIQWLGLLLIVASAIYVVTQQKYIQIRLDKTVGGDDFGFDGSFNMDHALQSALQDSDISLEFQPIKRLSDQGIFGAEVVVCWKHPSGQTLHVSPADFIELAEKSGLFLPFGHWVLDTACKQFAAWQLQYGPLILVLNLSSSQLKDPGFYQKVRNICEESNFPHQLIEYEVSEAVLLHSRTARTEVETFVQQGLSLTVDGFGLSPRSHELLEHFDIQKIKFAPQLIKNVAHDAEMLAHLQSFAQLALVNEVQMMADGLHQELQTAVMQKLGCVLGQGPHFNQPLSSLQFEAFLRDQSRDAHAQQKAFQQRVSGVAVHV